MKMYKIGNTSFNVDKFKFKTKSEFVKAYKGDLLSKELDEAWNELKKYIKEDDKPKGDGSKIEHNYKKKERE